MSIPDADYVYEALLRFNYFPMVKEHKDEIPPVFSSESFTPAIADQLFSSGSGRGSDGFDQIEYRITRFNNVIRKLDIPHPLPYAILCKTIKDNWSDLNHICRNERSYIRPAVHGNRVVVMKQYDDEEEDEPGRILVMDKSHFPEDALNHFDLTTGAKYRVEADIANCFPSIYSHAIPWAIVGQQQAKTEKSDKSKWYNKLDKAQRDLKRGETQGIPIGPATSNIVNEVILHEVDSALEKKNYRFRRFIDDYQCFTSSHDEAEAFIRDLELNLDRYLLRLNAHKVAINKLPLPRNAVWVTQLNIAVNSSPDFTPSRLVGLLDYALHLQRENPDSSVMKYAGRMLLEKVNEDSVEFFVRHLVDVGVHYPVVLPIACEVLQKYMFDCPKELIFRLIDEHLTYRRSDGVCWSLYLLYLCRGELESSQKAQIVGTGDCMAIASLMATDTDTTEVDSFLNSIAPSKADQYLLDRYWLLIYERARKDSGIRSLFATYLSDTKLTLLSKAKVSFVGLTPLAKMNRKKRAR